jgi:glycosyltransferase involved in cell wall biosynthesis
LNFLISLIEPKIKQRLICFFATPKVRVKMTEKSILIVNYYFPPFHRVGGRRWAKFAKYLFRSGWDVHVVAGDFPGSVSPWDKDTELYRDRIHRVTRKPLPLPFFKQKLPTNPIEKIRWKLSQWFFEFYTKKNYVGDYTDPSYLDGPAFAVAVRNVLTANPQIKNVVVSVGPYYYAMDVLKLKRDFTEINFVLDFRDVWMDWPGLSKKQIKVLSEFKSELHQLPDYFTTVSDILTDFLKLNYTQKSITIPHAIDEDDFIELPTLEPEPNKLLFVYGGDLYHGIEHRLTLLDELLKLLNAKGYQAEAVFYSDPRKHPQNIWAHLRFEKSTLLDEFFQKVLIADFALVVRGDVTVNQFTTKIFELVKLKRPILIIDKDQPELRFIKSKGLGLGLTHKIEIPELAEAIIRQKEQPYLPLDYDLKIHTIKHTTTILEDYLLNHSKQNN